MIMKLHLCFVLVLALLPSPASSKNRCNNFQLQIRSKEKTIHPVRSPDDAKADTITYGDTVSLGTSKFERRDLCVAFQASLIGRFFEGLKRVRTPNGFAFYKDDEPVSRYPDSVVVQVDAIPLTWLACHRPLRRDQPIPDITQLDYLPRGFVDGLRFNVSWSGSVQRELSELPFEHLYSQWSEMSGRSHWYRLVIPTENAPLTDLITVKVLLKGEELACMAGRLP